MRTLCRLALFAAITTLAASASAREVDAYANTSLTATPMHASSASSQAARHGDKEAKLPARPAKYDVAYPVHDHVRAQREAGAI